MKNKRNKKLLASFLLALSLSLVNNSNKVTNAGVVDANEKNYKEVDKSELNKFNDSVNTFFNNKNSNSADEKKGNLKLIYSCLLKNLCRIFSSREQWHSSSKLYSSMYTNGLSSKIINEEVEKLNKVGCNYNYNYIIMLMNSFFNNYKITGLRGRHFTVWNDKTIGNINLLSDFLKEEMKKINPKIPNKFFVRDKLNQNNALNVDVDNTGIIFELQDGEFEIFKKNIKIDFNLDGVSIGFNNSNFFKLCGISDGSEKEEEILKNVYGNIISDRLIVSNMKINGETSNGLKCKLHRLKEIKLSRLKKVDKIVPLNKVDKKVAYSSNMHEEPVLELIFQDRLIS